MDSKVKAARLSVLSNTFLVALKLTVGIMMHSVSVISEAIHSGLDLVASMIAYVSVKEASKPADEEHNFGHGKIENISGAVEALLIFGAALFIIYEGIKRILEGHPVKALGLGALVMGVSALINYFISVKLMKTARETDSVALEADALHLRTDVYTSVGVFFGLIAIRLTGLAWLDPAIAIFVALLIIKAAYNLTKECISGIVDRKLPDDEQEIIKDVLNRYAGDYLEYHKLRTRKAGAERHIDLHLVVPKSISVEAGHNLCHQIVHGIEARLSNTHVLVHIEPCDSVCQRCHGDCCQENGEEK